MSTAGAICRHAADLVEGDRNATHGEALDVYADLACQWNAHLAGRLMPGHALTALDVALMMVLLKVSRTKHGRHNPDNYHDIAGYGGIAGEIADLMEGSKDAGHG